MKMKDLINFAKIILGIAFILGAYLYADSLAESAAKIACSALFEHTRGVVVVSLQAAIAAIVGCCRQG